MAILYAGREAKFLRNSVGSCNFIVIYNLYNCSALVREAGREMAYTATDNRLTRTDPKASDKAESNLFKSNEPDTERHTLPSIFGQI